MIEQPGPVTHGESSHGWCVIAGAVRAARLNAEGEGPTLRQVTAAAHMPVVARVAAALVAIALSGAPRVAALHAPAKRHVCTCAHAGDHAQCGCVLCRRAAIAAQASSASGRPCCRSAARQQLAAERRAPAVPCVEGTCGGGAQAPVTFAGVEPFCPPRQPVFAGRVTAEPIRHAVAPPRERAVAPETPPPRSA